jgi:hypothetical protein
MSDKRLKLSKCVPTLEGQFSWHEWTQSLQTFAQAENSKLWDIITGKEPRPVNTTILEAKSAITKVQNVTHWKANSSPAITPRYLGGLLLPTLPTQLPTQP